jgi:outer membrane protein X
MRKILVVIGLLCSLNGVMAQGYEFKPFRVDAGLGYGLPFAKSLDAGVLFYLEPKYSITNQLALGVRWEGALFAGLDDKDGGSATVKLNSGYLLTGDYYLTNNSFRPFIGAGLGAFGTAGGTVTDSSTAEDLKNAEAKVNFGAMLRTGFDVSHFRFALSYNYGGKILNETHHYLGISVGFYIGGGKK